MPFTNAEIAYLGSQPLARIATVGDDGQPDVAPVGFEFDGVHFYVGGANPTHTRKFRNVRAGNEKVALVIDDLVSTEPWAPRFIRIYGTGELIERAGQFGPGPYMRITPTISWSWNLAGHPVTDAVGDQFNPRRTVHRLGGSSLRRNAGNAAVADELVAENDVDRNPHTGESARP